MNNTFNYSFLIDHNYYDLNQRHSYLPLEVISKKYIYNDTSNAGNMHPKKDIKTEVKNRRS